MAKKGHKKGKRKSGKRKDSLKSAMHSGISRGMKGGKKSNKRPLKLLKWAAAKMRTNLPKLESIIERRQAAGER